MDSRVPLVKSNRGFFVFDRSFPSLEAAERYADEVIKRRESIARRKLSTIELIEGVTKQDDRDPQQKMQDDAWKPVPPPSDDEPESWQAQEVKRLKKELSDQKKPLALRIAEDAAAAEEARRELAKRKEAFDNDPRRMKAVEAAEHALEVARYSPSTSYADVVRAEQNLAQARHGDLGTFREQHKLAIENLKNYSASERKAMDEKIAALEAARDAIGDSFEAEPAPTKPAFIQTDWEVKFRAEMDAEYERLLAEHRDAVGVVDAQS